MYLIIFYMLVDGIAINCIYPDEDRIYASKPGKAMNAETIIN